MTNDVMAGKKHKYFERLLDVLSFRRADNNTIGKKHRYTIIVPGLQPHDADTFAVNQVADLQFAWEDDGKTSMAVVRFPTNVVVVDHECPETVENLKAGLAEFREKMHNDNIAATEQATKGVKLPCYQ